MLIKNRNNEEKLRELEERELRDFEEEMKRRKWEEDRLTKDKFISALIKATKKSEDKTKKEN
jgi:hypothetical protein